MSTPPDSPRQRQVVVLDPGLKDHRTHHHVINRNLVRHAGAAGMDIRVVGHRRAVPTEFTYAVTPVFRRGIYEDTPALDQTAFAALVADHAHDLSQCLATMENADIVVHTATAAFLQALGATLAAGGHRVGSAVIQLMFHPLGLAGGEITPDVSMARYAEAFRHLLYAERGGPMGVHLSTSCHEFAQVFAGLGAGVVDVHPYALLAEAERTAWAESRSAAQASTVSCHRRAFLYGGDLKLDKGLAWVATALPTLLADHRAVDFIVHLGDNRFGDPRLDQLRRLVVEMSVRFPHLTAMEGHLTPLVWDHMIATADFLLLPYDPLAYRWKTSAVFWEMLLKRRPGAVMAVTQGTWMDRASHGEELDVTAVKFGDTATVSSLVQRATVLPAVVARRQSPSLSCLTQGNDDYITAKLNELNR